MKGITHTLLHLTKRTLTPPVVALAVWRLRQTWRLLLVIGGGILAAVVIACTVPLFSQVALNAGLHGFLTATPAESQLVLHLTPQYLSPSDLERTTAPLAAFMQNQFGRYLESSRDAGLSQRLVQTVDWPVHAPAPALQGQHNTIALTGVEMSQAASHLHLLQGQLPTTSETDVDMLVTPDTAAALQVTVGSTLTLTMGVKTTTTNVFEAPRFISLVLPLRVVGLMAPLGADPFWHGATFQPQSALTYTRYAALISTDAFSTTLSALVQQQDIGEVILQDPVQLFWYFSLDVAHITMDNLDDLIARLDVAPVQLTEQPGIVTKNGLPDISGPTLQQSNFPSSLEVFRDRAALVQIPMVILTVEMLALLLFFLSLIGGLLIDHQREAIALLRSRGASRREIFGAFALQQLGLGIVALLVGPLLAFFLTQGLGHLLLSTSDQSVLATTLGDPLQTALRVRWLVVAALASILLALLLALGGAARRDVLSLRREAARSTQRPLWQRLYLDLTAAGVALTGYGIALYLAHSGTLDARSAALLATPLNLVGPLFLLLAAVLTFLRLLPWLLRQGTIFLTRRRGAAPLLALAQMARAPQHAVRLMLLLALSVAFASFSLVYTASEQHEITTVATQQVGADFSGTLPGTPAAWESHYAAIPRELAAAWERQYHALPGVQAASVGYVIEANPVHTTQHLPVEVLAVLPSSFAQTSLWTTQDSSEPLGAVLEQLDQANYPSDIPTIPAVVDAVAWDRLHLAPGVPFFLDTQGLPDGIPFVAVAEVQHLPGVNDSLTTNGTGTYTTPGGVLADFGVYSLVYDAATHAPEPLRPNHVWLRTSDEPTALARVRTALESGPLRLETWQDRRALLEQMQQDPLYLALSGVLWLGTVTTLLPAVLGALLASWLTVRVRLTRFALLRALGSAPRQIASTLAWEQGIVFAVALLLGVGFGAVLVFTSVPGLLFANPGTPSNPISSDMLYVIQQVLPPPIVLSPTLLVGFAALVFICLLSIWMMARMVSRPSLTQTLRLNED
jgi:hypothetical protein